MSVLAPILQGFFTDRPVRQRQASDHTITAYRNTIRLLLRFAWQQTGRQPAQLTLDDLDAPLIGAFLHHLETSRGNSVTTRNARLAAIHSLFRYAALQAPDHAALIQRILAIPTKRTSRTIVCYLARDEMHALLAAPDQSTWHGRRDHALLTLAGQTGLRVSELTGTKIRDIHLGRGPHVRCHGKGRKDRITPLTSHTVTALRAWLTERRGTADDPLFPSRRSTRSAPTPSSAWSPSTPPLPQRPAHPSRPNRSPPIRCATAPRWPCCTPASTSPSSRSGSATNPARRPRYTWMPILRSRKRHSLRRPPWRRAK
jgi:integrase/recombinase XerD